MTSIRPGTVADLAAIVEVHCTAFPGFFLTRMGRGFLGIYYRTVLDHPDGIVLVAESEGAIRGFIAAFGDPPAFYRLLAMRRWRMLPHIVLATMRRPALVPAILANARRTIGRRAVPAEREVELASLGVSMQGRGTGKALVAACCRAARDHGAGRVVLTTDSLDNDRVNRFYRACDFRLEDTLWHGRRAMNFYVHDLR